MNIFKSFLNLFVKPVSTTNDEVEKATLKFGFIHAGVITAIFAICNFISTVISYMFTKSYDHGKYVTKFAFDNIIENIFSIIWSFIGTAIFIFAFIMAFAGAMLLIAKVLKTKTTFVKTLKIATFAITPYTIAKILSLIFAWFSPIGATLTTIASVYFVCIALFSFAKILGDTNKDKMVLCYIVVMGGITLITKVFNFIITKIGTNFFDSISSLFNL